MKYLSVVRSRQRGVETCVVELMVTFSPACIYGLVGKICRSDLISMKLISTVKYQVVIIVEFTKRALRSLCCRCDVLVFTFVFY